MQLVTDLAEILAELPGVMLYPQAVTANLITTPISLANFEVSTALVVTVGAVSGTNPTLTIQLQEAPSSVGTWTNLGLPIALTNVSANSLQTQLSLRTYGYLQAVLTVGGTSPSFNLALLALGQPKQSSLSSGSTRSPSQ